MAQEGGFLVGDVSGRDVHEQSMAAVKAWRAGEIDAEKAAGWLTSITLREDERRKSVEAIMADKEYWRLLDAFVRAQMEHERNTNDRQLRQRASEADVALRNHIRAAGLSSESARASIRGSLRGAGSHNVPERAAVAAQEGQKA